MANSAQVLTYYTREMLRRTTNNLQFLKNVSGEDMAGRFTEAPKKGETINIRKRAQYLTRSGEDYSAGDYIERSVPMVVQTTVGVDVDLTNRDLMFQIDYINERVIEPAAVTLASAIDTAALKMATQATANIVGTPGTVPTALKTYNQARALMAWEATPADSKHTLLVSPDMQVEIVDSTKGLFQSSSAISDQYDSGMIGMAAGAKWYECQNLYVHTVGPLGGTSPVTNAAAGQGIATGYATTTSLITDGWTAGAANRLKKGDVITIDGVYAVNKWTKVSTGKLRYFTVTADADSDSSGNLTAVISPAIISAGPYQNCSNKAADDKAITVVGSAGAVSPQGLRFHREAFLFASFDQPTPGGVEFSRMESDSKTGLKIRFLRDWNSEKNKQINRFDCVWAFGVAFPEFAARIAS